MNGDGRGGTVVCHPLPPKNKKVNVRFGQKNLLIAPAVFSSCSLIPETLSPQRSLFTAAPLSRGFYARPANLKAE